MSQFEINITPKKINGRNRSLFYLDLKKKNRRGPCRVYKFGSLILEPLEIFFLVLAYGIIPALLTTALQATSLTSNYWFEQVIVSTNTSSIPFAQEIHFGLFRHCTRRIPLGGSEREGSICQNLGNVDIGRVDEKLPEDVQTLRITMIVHFVFSALLTAGKKKKRRNEVKGFSTDGNVDRNGLFLFWKEKEDFCCFRLFPWNP